jgi:hypothetical protein
MGARATRGSSYDEQGAGLDDPSLPDFAAFCAARERFFRGLAGPAMRAEPDGAARGGGSAGSDDAPIAVRPNA